MPCIKNGSTQKLAVDSFFSLHIKYQRTTMNERGGWIFEKWQRWMYADPMIVSFSSLWIFVVFLCVCVRAKARVWTCTECRSDGMCTCQWLKWENPYWTACVCVFDLFSERSHFSLPHNLCLFPFVVSIDAVLPTEFIYRVKWTIPIRLGHGEHKNTLECCMMEKKSSMQYYYRSYNANEENIIILFFQNFVSLEEMNA